MTTTKHVYAGEWISARGGWQSAKTGEVRSRKDFDAMALDTAVKDLQLGWRPLTQQRPEDIARAQVAMRELFGDRTGTCTLAAAKRIWAGTFKGKAA